MEQFKPFLLNFISMTIGSAMYVHCRNAGFYVHCRNAGFAAIMAYHVYQTSDFGVANADVNTVF